MTESLLNVVELAEYVKKKREDESLSIRQVSEITQISPSTLSRIENGICIPDSDTLAKLTAWLGIPVDNLMRGELIPQIPTQNKPEGVFYKSTPDAVEAHLRADPNLNAETAKALAELFRVAYTQFAISDFPVDLAESSKPTKKTVTKRQPYVSRSRK
ncbi:MAG: helix-turn-helix transcriptional regulator [Acidobacteria bacterium]|nr:helix-turn-helix transcriptional regulator [Acidobacteriota bacterium]